MATPRLRLQGILPVLWSRARQYAKEDPIRIFNCAESMANMYLIYRNWEWFKARGLAERALLTAWSNQQWTFPSGPMMCWCMCMSDRAELLRWSDPFPEGDTYTLYRGIGGNGNPHGFSWTTDLDIAKRFANRMHGLGTIYKTKVRREDVYARIHESGRGEHEMLLMLHASTRLEVVSASEAA